MDPGLACHVCGTLNALSAQTCTRCGNVLTPGAPLGASDTASAAAAQPPVTASPVTASGGTQPGREPPQISPSASSTTAVAAGESSGITPAVPAAPSLAPGDPATPVVAMPPIAPVPETPVNITAVPPMQAGNPAAANPPGANPPGANPPGAPERFDPATGQPLPSAGGLGGPMPGESPAKTLFFGALQQQPVVPRLVVIKGEGGDGATYHLQGTTTLIGRSQGDITFAEDPFLSPEHAKFTSQTGRLFVQDMGSENGVFLRIKKPTPVANQTHVLVGEQLLRLNIDPFSEGLADDNGTYYYGSPRPATNFQLAQCLAGGGEGRISTGEDGALSLGREGNTMNFPDDRFISGHHARLDAASDSDEIILTDTGSRNGTFIRLDNAQELFHGDYLFVGQQLLRVEIA